MSGYLFTNVTETAETGTRLTVWQYPKTQPGDKLTQTIVDLYNAPETEYLIVSQGELYVRLALYSNQGCRFL